MCGHPPQCKPIPQVFPITQHHGTHGLRPHGADREGGGLEPITIAYGQSLVFKYSTHHDVWQHASAESLTACRYTDAFVLADTTQGGGCTLDEDLECIRNSVGFKITPTRSQVGSKLYLSCSVGDHCTNGQTIVVTIIDGPGPDPAAAGSAAAASGGSGGGGVPGPAGPAGAQGPAGPAGAAGSPSGGGAGMLALGMLLGIGLTGCALYAWLAHAKPKGTRAGAPSVPREIAMTSQLSRAGGSEDPRHVGPTV